MRLLSSIWSGIQRSLFSYIEEGLGSMTDPIFVIINPAIK